MTHPDINKIYKYLEDDNLEKALDKLDKLISSDKGLSSEYSDLRSLKFQYAAWNRSYIKGILSSENEQLEKRKIVARVLELNTKLDKKLNSNSSAENKTYYGTGIILILLITSIVSSIIVNPTCNDQKGEDSTKVSANKNLTFDKALECYYSGSLDCSELFEQAITSLKSKKQNRNKDILFLRNVRDYQNLKKGNTIINEVALLNKCDMWIDQLKYKEEKIVPYRESFIGEMYYEKKEYDKATIVLKNAEKNFTDNDPALSFINYQLAKIESKQKKYSLAKNYLNKGLSIQSDSYYSNVIKGIVYLDNNFEISSVAFKEAIQKANNPIDKSEVTFLLGALLLKNQDITSAKNKFKEAVKLNPNNLKALLYDALYSKDWQRKYKELINSYPSLAVVQYAYAKALQKAGHEDYCKYLEAAVDLNKENLDYSNTFSKYCSTIH